MGKNILVLLRGCMSRDILTGVGNEDMQCRESPANIPANLNAERRAPQQKTQDVSWRVPTLPKRHAKKSSEEEYFNLVYFTILI